MLHILLGDSADAASLLDADKTSRGLKWIVPKTARTGDRVVFHVAGGFIARGTIGSEPKQGRAARYSATVQEIALLAATVPLAFIRANRQDWKWPTYPRSYTTIDGAIEARLDDLLNGYQDAIAPLREGAASSVLVASYERNPVARQQCIAHYGTTCYVCGFSFGEAYGETAEGYIHVHHLKAVSKRGGEYVVDPIKDLRPICPNCHAVVHLRTPPLSILELKRVLKSARLLAQSRTIKLTA